MTTPAGDDSGGGAEVPAALTMRFTGRVEESGLADILRSLLRSRETGLVKLERAGVTKSVWVKAGRIVFAGSTDPDERLGESMLRDGLISVEQYDESARLIRPGKRQGTILVELGHLQADQLIEGVRGQVERIVRDLFHWRTGTYTIEIRELETDELIALAISTESLVFEGVRRAAGWSQVRRGLGGNMDTVLGPAPESDARLHRLDLGVDDLHVHSLANARLSIGQICAMSYQSSHDTCLTLYGLVCCGVLVPVAADEEARERGRLAEVELGSIRARLQAFNVAYGPIEAGLAQRLGDAAASLPERVLDGLLDEHYEVLHDVKLAGGLPIDLVLVNVAPIRTGWRRAVVDRAVDAVEAGIAREAGGALGPAVAEHVASAFDARRPR